MINMQSTYKYPYICTSVHTYISTVSATTIFDADKRLVATMAPIVQGVRAMVSMVNAPFYSIPHGLDHQLEQLIHRGVKDYLWL